MNIYEESVRREVIIFIFTYLAEKCPCCWRRKILILAYPGVHYRCSCTGL